MTSYADSLHVVTAGLGFVSFALLWAAVVTGFLLRNAWTQTRVKRPTLVAVHQTATVTGLVLGLFHGLTHLTVPGGTITLVEVVVPFLDVDDRIGLGAGVLGLELLAGVALSTVVQRRLGYARWRAVHLLAYAAFVLVVGHVLVSGRDATSPWVWPAVLIAWLSTMALWATTTPMVDGARRALSRYREREPDPAREVAVRVDVALCSRFGFCEQVAPQVFRLAADGQLSYRPNVPAGQRQNVVRAIEVCPARAISLAGRQRDSLRAQAELGRGGRPASPWSVSGVPRRNEISR